MGDGDIKVTDKRMFTPDGELREEFRSLGDKEAAPEPVAEPPVETAEEEKPEIERPDPAETQAFLELLSMLAEPAAIFLGDVPLPDGRRTENLDMARMHIDLLEVLKKKTAGNLSMEESSALEDVVYRLQMRYVQKRG